MDALMAALVLGALCQAGDKTPWLAAILGDRWQRRGLVVAAAVLAFAVNYGLAVVGGVLVAPLLTPRAGSLLLALALLLAGLTTTLRNRAPDRLEGWRTGPLLTAGLGLLIIVLGDRMQLVALALAARSPLPWAAAVGATLGALAVALPATMLGERAWLALPQRAIRIGSALVLVFAGLWIGFAAIGIA